MVLPPVKPVRPSISRVIGLESVDNPTMLTLNRERAARLLRIKELFDSHEKNKAGFLKVIEEFLKGDKSKRGHVEFIFSAVKRLEEFHVEKDFEVYHRLLDVFPTHHFYALTRLDALWSRYQPQIEAAVAVLERMDYFGVVPTYETVKKLSDILGENSQPVDKALRMGWWHSMMQDANPYNIGGTERYRPYVLAGLVLKRMAGQKSTVQIVRVRQGHTRFWYCIGLPISQYYKSQIISMAFIFVHMYIHMRALCVRIKVMATNLIIATCMRI